MISISGFMVGCTIVHCVMSEDQQIYTTFLVLFLLLLFAIRGESIATEVDCGAQDCSFRGITCVLLYLFPIAGSDLKSTRRLLSLSFCRC